MNKSILGLSLALSVAALFGFGCVRPGPRIVVAPRSTNPPVVKTDTVPDALAYARLEAASATLIRDELITTLEDGQALGAGDEIKVNVGAVELIYPDAGVSRIEAGTNIVLLPQTDETREGEISAEIQLIAGNVWTRFERLLGSSETFSVSANGVVATVRGTAFGVSLDADGVEVQVAESQVEVITEREQRGKPTALSAVRVVAGQGLKIQTAQMAGLTPPMIRRLVRNLSDQEKRAAGFLFGSKRLNPERIQRPPRPIPLTKPTTVPERFRDRFEFLRDRETLRLNILRFGVPTTTPDLKGSIDPSVTGPSELNP